jgi:BirA family biotin operon repressor/biotin-[acetyl-CoA-carboxylase] ligase
MRDAITHEIRRFRELDSTNDYCFRNADALLSGTVVLTGFQSAGKGTQGRDWVSEADANLLFSIIFKGEHSQKNPLLSLRIALALVHCLRDYGLEPLVKWPNDILIDGSKIAGILIEVKDDICVIGVGLNLNQQTFPDDLRMSATSLFNRMKSVYEPVSVLLRILDSVDEMLEMEDRFVLEEYRETMSNIGHTVSVNSEGKTINALVLGIDDGGVLLVADQHGRKIRIPSAAMLVDE